MLIRGPWLLLLSLAACSFTFDEEGGGLPLVGAPPAAPLPLNRAPVESARLMRGVDESLWVAMREQGSVLRLRRLDLNMEREMDREEVWSFEQVQAFSRVFYLVQRDRGGGTEVLVRVPGDPEAVQRFVVPAPPADVWLLVGGEGAVSLSWVRDAKTRTFEVRRRDGRGRVLPAVREEGQEPVGPAGIDPKNPQAAGLFFFDGAGDWLFVRDTTGRVWAHATAAARDVDLGTRPRALYVDEGKGGTALVACGEDGLRRVPLDGAEVVLSSAPCTAGLRILGRRAYYVMDGQLKGVPLDGSEAPAPVTAPGAQQVLGFTPAGELMYSLDPADLYVRGASDGWIGGWRFMARGRLPAFSGDGTRLRYLESAATLSGSGDLMSAPARGQERGGEAALLGRNVRSFAELPDRRLLLVANYAFRGAQNRIVVLDEQARVARWVADEATGYLLLPGAQELLALLLRSGRGSDVVRVSIPGPGQ